jgi:septation ring formation regulator EzrA
MSLPKSDLVELVLNTRKQLRQYVQVLEEKESKMSRLKKQYREAAEELDRVSGNNEKLIEYVRCLQ